MMMDSGCLIFDSSSVSPAPSRWNMPLTESGNYGFRGGGGRPVVLSMEENGGVTKRRPFFSTHEELMMEDEYYDEQLLPEKKRRLTADQVHLLESSFEAENKLEPERKSELAKKLGLQPRQVAVWFQNRRARWKTKQLERDFDRLKSSYDALRADHETLLQQNQRLRSQVASLTEKRHVKEPAGSATGGSGGGATENPPPSLQSDRGVRAGLLKSEDHLSTGSGASAVVDGGSPQLLDSGDSYFPDGGFQRGCTIGTPPSEEDDGSDNGRNYLSGVFAAAAAEAQQQHEPSEEETNGMGWSWVVWS